MESTSHNEALSESPLNTELAESYFCQAVEHNYERALQALLAKMENPSAVVNKEYTVESGQLVPILFACEKGYITVVETLLKYGGAESLQKHNKHNWNCLHTACRAGSFQMVKLLCEYASKELSKKNRKKMINLKSSKYAWTPLMLAIQARQVEIVELLLKSPDIILYSQNKNRQNVAHIAAQYSLDCLKAIQSSPHVSSSLFLATDKEGWGILHRACAGDNVDTVKWIMVLRTTLNGGVFAPGDDGYSNTLPLLFERKLNEKTRKGYTPLLVACEYQHKDMVEYLLSFPDVDPSASTSMDGSGEGNTGLHIAAIHDSPEIAKLLIDRCPTAVFNKEGDTALHIAHRKSSFDVYDIIKLTGNGVQEILNENGLKAEEIEPEEAMPPEILKRGSQALHTFRKALREGKGKIFPQYKLLVLGEARVGKTSLIRHLTGCEFISNLEQTHGIENQCITRMVDSVRIDASNWKTITIDKQAEEHYISAIAEVIKAENPAMLETKTEDDHDNVKTEPKISETQLLCDINQLFDNPIRSEPKKIKKRHRNGEKKKPNSKAKFKNLESKRSKKIKRLKKGGRNDEHKKKPNSKARFKTSTRILVPSKRQMTTRISPPSKRQKTGINNESISRPLPNSMPRDPHNGTNAIPEPVYTRIAAPIEPVTTVVEKNTHGRRSVQGVWKHLTARQKTHESKLCIEVLDFAGQKEYRPMHHCFMSRRAIYIVVFNLQHLCDPEEKKKTFSDLKYWLNSVHAHVHNPKKKYEKYIFLVGTHKNPGNGKRVITDDLIAQFSHELKEELFKGDYCFKNAIHFFSQTDLIMTGLENSEMDQINSGLKAITKEIDEFSKRLPFSSEVYPASWLCFMSKLMKIKTLPGSVFLELAEAENIARNCGVNNEDVHTALVLLHDIGTIIYLGLLKSIFLEEQEKVLISKMILIEPQWLVTIMKKVMEVRVSHPNLINTEIDKCMKTGMANSEFLYELWKDDHKGDEKEFQKICLLMRAYGLMQTIKSTTCVQFMIPSLLNQEKQILQNGFIFYFDFKGFLPQEVFHCLICLVIKTCPEVPDCSPPKFSAKACIWYCFKGYDWCIQPMSKTHRLKVVASPRKKKDKDDLTPLECISFLHKEFIRPICEQSGLPGLTYIAGPIVEACEEVDPPHKVGVLAAVCYPDSGSNGLKALGRCPTCREEYDIEKVLHQTSTAGASGSAPIGDNGSDRRREADDFKNDQIGEDDLVDVEEKVIDLAANWRSLGLALRLMSAELDTISTKNHTDPTECLRDMLLAWLQQRYDFKKFGLPSWRMLCQAISSPVGGNNPALARKIAEHH